MIKSVGYDEKTRILEVEFSNNSVYQYSSVPEIEYREMIRAKSVASYFTQSIKTKYKYEKIQ